MPLTLPRVMCDDRPFNSWDRVPYVTLDAAGAQQVGPQRSHIHHNLILCTYKCTWPIDHDDGSNTYLGEGGCTSNVVSAVAVALDVPWVS